MNSEQTYHTATPRSDVLTGFMAALPLWLGAAPFGIIYAISAIDAGLSPLQTLAMSLFVFAGAAQFTAVGMFAVGSGPLAIIATTLVVNARHLLLTFSLLSYLRGEQRRSLLVPLSMLTDESYALALSRFLNGNGSKAFLIGANVSIYVSWQISTMVGIWLGRRIPDPTAYGLDLVFPLTFIGLLMPLLKKPELRPVAIAAGLISTISALWLPGGWHILLAALGVGVFVLRKKVNQ